SVCPTDSTKGFLQNMQLGDYVDDRVNGGDSERFRIVQQTINSPTDIDLVLQRITSFDVYCGSPHEFSAQMTHANGWDLRMTVIANHTGCGGQYFVFSPDSANPYFYVAGAWARGHIAFGVGDV